MGSDASGDHERPAGEEPEDVLKGHGRAAKPWAFEVQPQRTELTTGRKSFLRRFNRSAGDGETPFAPALPWLVATTLQTKRIRPLQSPTGSVPEPTEVRLCTSETRHEPRSRRLTTAQAKARELAFVEGLLQRRTSFSAPRGESAIETVADRTFPAMPIDFPPSTSLLLAAAMTACSSSGNDAGAGEGTESASGSVSDDASATAPTASATATASETASETEGDETPGDVSNTVSDTDETSNSGPGESSDSTEGECEPITCAEMGFDCGTIFDGCGDTEECGSCVEPATCGTFEDNVCGCEETEWVIEHVAFMDNVGSHTSMAVDGEGNIHIAYQNTTDSSLNYATRGADGGAWTNELVDNSAVVGVQTAMDIDGDGGVHIAYNDTTNRGLAYAYKPSGGTWNVELASVDDNGVGADIDVDDNGVVHISHLRGNRVPFYTFGNLGSWTTEQAGAGPVGAHGPNLETGIAVDPEGGVHLCIGGEGHNGTSGALSYRQLVYGYRSLIGSWSRERLEGLDDGFFVGAYCDIELDDTGAVHIVHFDTHNWDLRYATNPMPPLGDWTMELVDGADDVGERPSLEVDEFGTLSVSYYDNTNQELKLARKPLDGEWEAGLLTDGTGLATEGEIGIFSALTAEDSANLHVAYYEGMSDDLYYAYLATCPL